MRWAPLYRSEKVLACESIIFFLQRFLSLLHLLMVKASCQCRSENLAVLNIEPRVAVVAPV